MQIVCRLNDYDNFEYSYEVQSDRKKEDLFMSDYQKLSPYSCRPFFKETYDKYWETEFPDGGWEECNYVTFYDENGE